VRIAVAIVAVVVIAWLGVMYRDAHLQARGVAVLRDRSADRDLRGAEADLLAARFLNPDAAPDTTRAVIYRAQGRDRDAIALLDEIVRREPDNLSAWSVMRLSATGTDTAAFKRSLAQLQRLDPVNVPRGR
jgi:hypothetical protein